jgi:hypothetical protein
MGRRSVCRNAQPNDGMHATADTLPLININHSGRRVSPSAIRDKGSLTTCCPIVRQIVEAHGGTVEAESPGAGRGAAFRVRLPLAPGVDHLPPVGDEDVINYAATSGR